MNLSNIGLVFCAALFVGTILLAYWRISAFNSENNWPLFYYAGIVIFHNSYPGVFYEPALYVAIIAGLFLRFEFLNRTLVLIVRAVELVALAYLGWVLAAATLEVF
jgi:hypothetical protein